MNIYAKEWDVVRFLNENGWDGEAEEANRHLEEGALYTVDYVIINSWSSEVYLKEVPGIGFNTVMFEDAEEA